MHIPESLRWKPTGQTLGTGGQATVFVVVDGNGELQGEYALKSLAPDRPKQAYERLHREITALTKLDHPYIIRVLDHSPPGAAFHYYVMEYHPGAKPLLKLLEGKSDENPFHADVFASLTLFIQLAEVIDACDRCDPKIIHRDLSPGNVLILPDQTIRVIDFGICQIDGATPITLLDEGLGTRNYAAPECETGGTHEITARSDVYSAGKILWSAITGQRAFAREEAVFNAKSMYNVFRHLPETWHLHHVFEKSIRRDPSDRWSASSALAQAKRLCAIIRAGYPPLETMGEACPLCGIGALRPFEGSHTVFGNPNPGSLESLQCNYCFYCFVVDPLKQRKSLADRQKLS